FASRRNYDVARGLDAEGRWCCGVLEPSWRLGGASGPEVAALEAFRAGPALTVVRAWCVGVYGPCGEPPPQAVVHFRGVDDRLGFVGLVFDLRGHARSEGRRDLVSREDNLRDALAAYDLLAGARGVDPSAVGVVGSSYGGYLAAVLTSLRPVCWLGLRAPAL